MKHAIAIVLMVVADALGLDLVVWLMRQPGDWMALAGLTVFTALGVLTACVVHMKFKALMAGE